MAKNAQGLYDQQNQPNWSNPAEVEDYRRQIGAPPSDTAAQLGLVRSGGYNWSPDMVRRASDFNYGMDIGKQQFIDDPEMQRLKKIREEYAKGYSGEELGGIRQTARGEIAGAQQAQQRKLAAGLAKGGVGGARGAAIQAAQGREGQKAINQAETKMALDSAQMKRQGAADLQDYIFRAKYGQLGVGTAMAGLGASDYAAAQARAANQAGKSKSVFDKIMDAIF